MSKSFSLRSGVSVKHISDAAQDALNTIHIARTSGHPVLLCRHSKVNKLLLGGWQFDKTYVIGARSGSGKSSYLNMLYQDFLNPQLNGNYPVPFRILHFALEMSASDEVLRSTSGYSKTPYRDLLSADHQLDDEKYNHSRQVLERLAHQNMYFVEDSLTVNQIKDTIMDFHSMEQGQLIVGIDHTLLARRFDERSEVELITNLSHTMLQVRKTTGCMMIPIVQFNDEIESPENIRNKYFHYPRKRYFHGSKAIWHDADFVFGLHVPEKLGISKYGPNDYFTKDVLFMHFLKGRFVEDGQLVRFHNHLKIGELIQWEDPGVQADLKYSEK